MSINIAAVAATTTTAPSSSSFPSSSPPICLQQQQQQTFEHQIHNQTPPPIPHPSEELCYVHCSICDTVLAVSVPSASLFKMVTVRCGHCSNLLPVNMRAVALIHPPLPSHDPHQQQHQQQQFHFPPNLSPVAGTGVTAISTNAVTNTTAIGSAPSTHSSFLDEIQSAGAPNFPPSLINTSHQINGNNNFIVTTTNMAGGVGGGNSTTIAHNQDQLFFPRQVAAPPVVNRPPEKRQRVPSAYNRFIKDEIQRIKAGNPDITHRQAFSAAAKNWAHFPHIHFGLMPGHHHHHAIRKTNICPQEGDDMIHMKDGFLASANVSVLPY